MCGITGFADFRKKSSEAILKNMAASMPHRGPDGQSDYFTTTVTSQVGLGHRRLSIIDLSHAADQPMSYEEWVIIFNGEIYNYQEIKDELVQLGHRFNTHSDTEVILHSWKEWGTAAIRKWHGMFAIALFDQVKNEIIFIRDRAGVKPLHYYHADNLFLFGSELKTLMAHPDYPRQINHQAVASFLQYGYVPSPHTIFQDTHKLPAGHLLRLNLLTGDKKMEQYWNVYDYYNKPKLTISLPEAIEETERILKKAFQYRMVADVPVGVFLSGGYDSTCVTSLLQSGSTEKIKTFTIGTTDSAMDEAPFAKQIAAHLGTDHAEFYCTPQEALNIIPDLSYYFDEPFADSSAIPTILVSRLARKKVTVALSADAGDEIFAGYNRYDYVSRYIRKIRKIPAPLRKLAAAGMEGLPSNAIPFLQKKPNFHSRYDKLKNLLNDPSPAELLKNLSIVFADKEVKAIMSEKITLPDTGHNSQELHPDYYDELSYMMAVDYQTYMVDDILQKVDRATMSASLEGREPFLDQSVIEWAATLPAGYKYHNGTKKYILRQIVHKHVPQSIMERPKMGFGIPIAEWMQNELKEMVRDYLSEKSLKKHNIFNPQAVQKLLRNFEAGRKEEYLKIWYLLTFQLWYEKWMNG